MKLNNVRANAYEQAKQSSAKAEPEKSASKKTLADNSLLKVPAVEQSPDGKDSVYRRVAKFLLIIGENEAAKILPHLSDKQIEKIVPEIASIRSVGKEESAQILEEFQDLLENARQSSGVEAAREMLTKAYGKNKAEELLKKTVPMEGKKPFEYFNDADCERVYLLLKDENVGIKSLVLSYLEPKKAAGIINLMEEDEKKDVVLRLAKMAPISPEVLQRVDKAMYEKSLNQTSEKAEHIDGRNALAQILKKMDFSAENGILKTLSQDNPELGQELRERLFTQDDILRADDRFIQKKLREMDDKNICYLLAGKTDDFRAKILSNVSSGRRVQIIEQEGILRPFRKVDCDAVTSHFYAELRQAYEDGTLMIIGNDDEYID